MLIDLSYFTGPLSIANLPQPEIQEAVEYSIASNEEEFLVKAMGYDLYSSFIQGLTLDPVPEKWLKILQGTMYTNAAGRSRRWIGFANANAVSYISNQTRETEFHTAGEVRTNSNGDAVSFPVDGTTLVDSSLNNWDYSVDIRAFGELNPETEWERIPGGGINVLIPGYASQADELWILRFKGLIVNIAAAGEVKLSPIANYAWWHYMRDLNIQTAGVGQAKASAENAAPANPKLKMDPVWNQMNDMLSNLWDFLYQNQDDYVDDGYYYSEIDRHYFKKHNMFNL